jgi:hypothetical protein
MHARSAQSFAVERLVATQFADRPGDALPHEMAFGIALRPQRVGAKRGGQRRFVDAVHLHQRSGTSPNIEIVHICEKRLCGSDRGYTLPCAATHPGSR